MNENFTTINFYFIGHKNINKMTKTTYLLLCVVIEFSTLMASFKLSGSFYFISSQGRQKTAQIVWILSLLVSIEMILHENKMNHAGKMK